MDLIIGGAYQGKLSYACKTFGLGNDDICDCREADCDLSRRCLYHYEEYVRRSIREGKALTHPQRPDAVIIADDIFCGVVSIDPEERLWREECGRALTALSLRSESVTRLFCGLPLRLRG